MRRLIANISLAVTATLVLAAPTAAAAEPASSGPTPFVDGELLVRFQGGEERVVTLPAAVGVPEAARALNANAGVAYAVPNYIAKASSVPNDPGQGAVPGDWQRTQWNFLPCGSLCGQSATALPFEARGGINAVGAWDILRSRGKPAAKGVKVAVLDTGVAYMSERPGYRKSPDFSRGQFLPGYNFAGKDKNAKKGPYQGGPPLDHEGHGTHVAGTIAERTGNGFGLTGLASRAKIIPVQVLDAHGFGTARDIAEGIEFAAKNGAHVINMSFEFSLAVNSCAKIKGICAAVKMARKRGAIVIAAAGNSNGEPVAYPGGAPGVVAVGRTTKDACLADLSRTGGGLDLVAPGGGIPLSPTCGADDALFSRAVPIFQLTFLRNGDYRRFGYPSFYEGTSMAAAHVSGVAAMVIASGVLGGHPSADAVECQLKLTARNKPGQLGQDYDARIFGAGLVDAAAAVTARAPGC